MVLSVRKRTLFGRRNDLGQCVPTADPMLLLVVSGCLTLPRGSTMPPLRADTDVVDLEAAAHLVEPCGPGSDAAAVQSIG